MEEPVSRGGTFPKAWCVSHLSFVTIALAGLANLRRQINVPDPGPPHRENVEFVLTEQKDADLLFNASYITLVPRDTHHEWLTQPASCTGCSSLGLLDVPVNMADLELNITLPNPEDRAVVKGYTWSHN